MSDDAAVAQLAPLRYDSDGWCVATATVAEIAGRRLLLIPFAAPVGSSRGRRFVVRLGGESVSHQRTVLSVKGQAAIVLPIDLPADTPEVEISLRPVRDARPPSVPTDFAAALAAEDLELTALPEPVRVQLLHMINESATADVRIDRVAAAVAAVRTWSRRAAQA